MHHPGLQHSKSTSQLDTIDKQNGGGVLQLSLPPDENGNQLHNRNKSSTASKFGLLIRTPRRRRANCFNQTSAADVDTNSPSSTSVINRLRSKSWDQQQSAGMNVTNNPGKSTWSGWRSLRKISDTLIDYALNEPYKADSVFDDSLTSNHSIHSTGIYRRRSELIVNDATVRKIEPTSTSSSSSVRGFIGSKTVGHAQGVRLK